MKNRVRHKGYYSSAGAGSCTACPTGQHSGSGSGVCLPCDVGTYAAAKASTSCTACAAGHYQVMDGYDFFYFKVWFGEC